MCGGLLGYCRSEFGVNRECSESELCQRERYFYSLGVVNVPRIKDSSIAHDTLAVGKAAKGGNPFLDALTATGNVGGRI